MKWSGKRYDTGQCVEVTASGGKIAAIDPIAYDGKLPWLSPGWIDLQVNGFAGCDLNGDATDPEEVLGVTKAMFACGVTGYLPTVITGSFERIHQALTAIKQAIASGEDSAGAICGIHVEGPYLSGEDGPRGAHDRRHIRDPDLKEFDRWQEASGGMIKLVTIAPERQGAPAFVRELTNEGVAVSIGHTMATAAQIEAAVAAGASLSTHLGNGAHPVLPRHPNYIWDQLAEDGLQAMFIADGHHLPANTLKAMMRAKRDRFIIVSDCVKFGGMAPGVYKSLIGSEVELLPNGRLQTAANPAILAGSAQSIDRGVENAVKLAGLSLKEAVEAVTLRPAAAVGLRHCGKLEPGADASLTLFDFSEGAGKLSVRETVLKGKTVFKQTP
ncbi:N-acetylglucosamine-6-phosphate deacetylase [Paenibacillus sp. MBLB4367]|uniref:N-acetylglucosamine-6-phosphate deacetylase n=1 Tax=Paenibacillus sp. MBLB4367 TaxID=3384767 RepID=UPI0039081D90